MKAASGEDVSIDVEHSFLMLCNKYAIDILKCADANEWSSEILKIKPKDKKKYEDNPDIFYWRTHGYAASINKSLYKHIVFSLVGDYNKYMYDAINCASIGHFGPAFTLLRKPLKDDLLMLEMLYIKGYRFIPYFLNNSISNIAIDRIPVNTKKDVLRKTCKKLDFYSGKRMYDLRYNKKSKESLEKIWNPTSHIITTCKDYPTDDGNFNIIFATDDIVENHIVYFYKVCCSVQLYFVKLLLNIIHDENLISDDIYHQNRANLFYAFLSTLDDDLLSEDDKLKTLKLKCDCCNSVFSITKSMIIRNREKNIFEYKCNKCNKTTNITGFIN